MGILIFNTEANRLDGFLTNDNFSAKGGNIVCQLNPEIRAFHTVHEDFKLKKRELSGANVNVGSDLLPGSTERCVSVTGSKDAVTQAGCQLFL